LPSISWSTSKSCCSQIHMYRISRPIRRTFFPKNLTQIRPASYAPRVSIISKLINTRTFIIHLYCERVKFASKSWDLASFYYGC
jgi:hypothetical protein